MAAEADKIRL